VPANSARVVATPDVHMEHIRTALEGVGDAVAAEQAVPRIPGQSLLHPDDAVRIYGIQFHSPDCKGHEAISLRGPSRNFYRAVNSQDDEL